MYSTIEHSYSLSIHPSIFTIGVMFLKALFGVD